MKTKNIRDKEFQTDVTLHLIRIGGDVEHIKEDISEVKDHLSKINGRVRENEKQISWMQGIGVTITFIIGSILTWLKLGND